MNTVRIVIWTETCMSNILLQIGLWVEQIRTFIDTTVTTIETVIKTTLTRISRIIHMRLPCTETFSTPGS